MSQAKAFQTLSAGRLLPPKLPPQIKSMNKSGRMMHMAGRNVGRSKVFMSSNNKSYEVSLNQDNQESKNLRDPEPLFTSKTEPKVTENRFEELNVNRTGDINMTIAKKPESQPVFNLN